MKKRVLFLMALLCLVFRAYTQQVNNNYTQTIRGTVVDKELQLPIPGAVVELVESTSNQRTITDLDGNFKLTDVTVGRHTIRISLVGYKMMQIPNLTVSSGKETVVTVSLEEDIIMTEEVVVKVKKNASTANNNLIQTSVTNLRTEDINRFAGSRQDPSRMAANYAGVAGGGDLRNDIIVRGNSPAGVLWRLEGVDIPNPNHFTFTGNTGGAFSILNNNSLANSDFLTGAFPAEYGNKTAAVFDVRLRNGNNQKRENTFQIGMNGIEFGTEGPISRDRGSSYMASYRFLSFEALDKMGVSVGVSGIPQFQDATFKINLPTEKAGTFTLWGIGGKSTIFINEKNENPLGENPVTFESDDFKSEMFATGLSHQYNFSQKTVGKLSLSASGNRIGIESIQTFGDNTALNNYNHKNTEGQYLATYVLTHKINTKHLVKGGVIYRSTYYSLYDEWYNDEKNEVEEGLNSKGNAGLLQAYAHWQYRLSDRFTVNTGLYYQYFMLNNTKALEPRVSAAYVLDEKQKITFASGMHSQTHFQFVYDYKFKDEATGIYRQPNRDLDFTRSIHFVGGYQRSLGSDVRLKTELYYQYLYDVPVSLGTGEYERMYSILNTGSDYSYNIADNMANKGTGTNYGVEVTLEKAFSKNYYVLTNLSLLDSKYKTVDGIERNTPFNIGHVVNVLVGKEFHLDDKNHRVIALDVRLNHSGGRRIIAIDPVASKEQGKAVYDFENAFEAKIADYFRADIKASYNINRSKTTHHIFIAADNVMNTQNEFYRDWDKVKEEVVTYYQMGVFPYLGYRIQF